MELFAILSAEEIAPVFMFIAIMTGTFLLLSKISSRNNQAEERLERIGRPKSLVEIDMAAQESQQRFAGLRNAFSSLGSAMQPQSELEKNTIRVTLANAGFRSESAPAVFQGIRLVFAIMALLVAGTVYYAQGTGPIGLMMIVLLGGGTFFLPKFVLEFLKNARQKEVFLTLPDALDLLVVCVESGLGLDAAMRKVTDEMKDHAKVLTEEFSLANLQLQMGRPRREVLHDLGIRTGVDDVKSLAAILIQADRFGSSIAQALRVQSDSMRVRRRQLAEEKAAATAVKLIFPLVLFIFPAIFVVLVGPAAIQIQKNLLK